jgi:hypothetical protein
MNRLFTLALMTTACSDNSLKVVNSAPEAEITYPTEGAEVLEAVEQTLYGWVADRDGPTEDLRVRWFQGADTLLCDDVVPDSSGDVFCTAAFEMDAVSVRLEVVDKRGGLGQDSVDFKMVPTDAPTAEILRPEGEFGFYVGQLITFEGVVADGEDEASTLTATWESTIDGPLDTIEASPNPSGELLGFGELTEGEHGITLTVTDSTGKQATDSVVVAVGASNSAPTCEITAPETGSMFTSGDTITFVADVQDVDVPSDWLSVVWTSSVDGDIGTSTPATSGEANLVTDALTADTHIVTLTVTDEQGGSCTDTITTTIGSPPEVVITAPADDAAVQGGDPVTFEGWVSDLDEAADLLVVAWTSSLDGPLDSSSANADGEAGFSTATLSAGAHTVTLQATDDSGETDSDSIVVNVNGQPTVGAVTISYTDPEVWTSTALSCVATATDFEGESLSIAYTWTNSTAGTTLVAGVDDTTVTLSPESASADDTIVCTATATDTSGGSGSGSDSVLVVNSTPTAPTVSISPDEPGPFDDLVCSIDAAATDPDGDALSYELVWTIDGGASGYSLAGAPATATLTAPASATLADEVWTCTITANDGTTDGPGGSASVTVENSPPSAPTVSITPDEPNTLDDLVCGIDAAATDPDGDALSYELVWTVDGSTSGYSLAGAPATATLTAPASATLTDEVWTCTITANDGTTDSPGGSDSVLVVNSTPSAPTVSISPDEPNPLDDLVCSIDATATDADGDALSYELVWTVDGSTSGYSLTGASATATLTAPASATLTDEVWTCTITPNDGTTDGPGGSDSVLVVNSTPSAPTVSISPDEPNPLDDLVCSIDATATDADGDPLSYDFVWTVDGDASGYSLTDAADTDTLSVPAAATELDEVWTCSITANDGSTDGPTGTANVTILTRYVDCGDGVIGLPIATCEDLEAISEDGAETYCLVNDVDCSTIADFDTVAISVGGIDFSGVLLGNGYAVTDFSTTGSGLFRKLSGEVRDLTMTNVLLVPTATKAGAIAGSMLGAPLIHNVHITGAIDATAISEFGDYTIRSIGGLVGSTQTISDGEITDSTFSGTINGGDNVGGIIGVTQGITISGCSVTGTITGERYLGGIVGSKSAGGTPGVLTLSDCSFSGDIIGDTVVGGICGTCGGLGSTMTIDRCLSEGTVTALDGSAGGLVAINNAPIRDSGSHSAVVGTTVVGGLVGSYSNGDLRTIYATVERSFATGDVVGEGKVGGLIGSALFIRVFDSYALGDVDGAAQYVGGFMGWTLEGGEFERSYSAGAVTGTATSMGGFLGASSTPPSFLSTYWDTDSSGFTTSDGGEGRTTTEMTTEATFVDWDFTDTWTIDEGTSYPCLQWQGEDCPVP